MDRKIRMIVPVPVPKEALEAFASQIPAHLVAPGVTVEFACAARGGTALDSHYEGVIADAYCLEAGARAEAEGCAAVCINSMSDSGVAALRSRLTIPVVGTAQSTYALAGQLGRRFSILSMWDRWRWLFDKVLREQGMDVMAAIRKSASQRLRPILMTTGAMVLGALPLALATGAGAESRRQIGWVIVGGMSLGTLLTIFVVPTMYTLLARRHAPGAKKEVAHAHTGAPDGATGHGLPPQPAHSGG